MTPIKERQDKVMILVVEFPKIEAEVLKARAPPQIIVNPETHESFCDESRTG